MKRERVDANSGIDAVILWVDGSDPVLAAKRRKYSAGTSAETHDDIAGATRFADNGEVKWCVRSIERFAPWIRKIYIVTDGQDPQIRTKRIPLEIVDHTVIFRGYEQYLPTFNSLSLETMLWRIPGLSERFLYFNDDICLISPTSEEDFFTPDGRPIAYGRKRSTAHGLTSLTIDRVRSLGNPKVKFRYMMLNAARLIGRKEFFLLEHTPYNVSREVLSGYYSENPEAMVRNLRHRFRDIKQYSPIELNYLLGGAELRDASEALIYLEPKQRKIEPKPAAKFLCVNSLDQFEEAERQAVVNFIESRLQK